ncbi:hypothetical protein G9A89_008785 [Geosiphon pyriformis]|nr:hypothetical protein G9A89_008785 [Geosiphon pyriformis]
MSNPTTLEKFKNRIQKFAFHADGNDNQNKNPQASIQAPTHFSSHSQRRLSKAVINSPVDVTVRKKLQPYIVPRKSRSLLKKQKLQGKKRDGNNIVDTEDLSMMPLVPDVIGHDLDVLFCGINPGVASSAAGHHFAKANNKFYPCLVESGLTNGVKVTFQDDVRFPRDFNLGITNVVNRVTRSSQDLTRDEMIDRIPNLIEKVQKYRPKYLCFIGKCVFDAFMIHHDRNPNIKKYGLQDITILWGTGDQEDHATKVFSIMSTSGRVVLKPQERIDLFKELKLLLNQDKLVKKKFTSIC